MKDPFSMTSGVFASRKVDRGRELSPHLAEGNLVVEPQVKECWISELPKAASQVDAQRLPPSHIDSFYTVQTSRAALI
ncbi:unnamed protein product [Nezara viridula]|uniref:Uncharacterized protein n=1 Tax=Nezara viridula TaxID=85310 RepID=A0A9P0MPJ8_NEZVI|nr:unnamed protein product [Nezara viridula]